MPLFNAGRVPARIPRKSDVVDTSLEGKVRQVVTAGTLKRVKIGGIINELENRLKKRQIVAIDYTSSSSGRVFAAIALVRGVH